MKFEDLNRFLIGLVVGFVINLSSFAYGEEQDFVLVYKIGIVNGESPLEYRSSAYSGVSPHDLAFIDDNIVWIAQANNAVRLDIRSGTIVGTTTYPKNPEDNFYIDTSSFVFGKNWSVELSSIPIVTVYDASTFSIRKTYGNLKPFFSIADERPTIIDNTAYLLGKNGRIFAVSSTGTVTPPEKISGNFIQSYEGVVVSKPQDLGGSDSLESENYLVHDGIFYPFNTSQLKSYFAEHMSGDSQGVVSLDGLEDGQILGQSKNGDIYLRLKDVLYVVSQKGNIVQKINILRLATKRTIHTSDLYFAIRPNGDVYSLITVKDDAAYFYSYQKKW